MKKSITAVLLCSMLFAFILLTGCGDKGTDTAKSTDTASEKQEATSDEEGTKEDTSKEDTSKEDTSKEDTSKEDTSAAASVNQVNTDQLLSGKHHAKLVIKDYGTIELELDADTAPISVTNFVKLAESDFYDGLTFHRIIDGFMMQGGDPKGNGTGGSDETIKGEFEANGIENNLSHKRGVISMARAQAMDSASSQFFIVQKDSLYLDGKYAAFGTVTEGIEIVDEICKKAQPVDSNGSISPAEQPVIETIDIID